VDGGSHYEKERLQKERVCWLTRRITPPPSHEATRKFSGGGTWNPLPVCLSVAFRGATPHVPALLPTRTATSMRDAASGEVRALGLAWNLLPILDTMTCKSLRLVASDPVQGLQVSHSLFRPGAPVKEAMP
jgi:hypothetical protein